MGVVGEFNKNLQELEKITNCSLYSRGNSILIKSTPEQNEKIKNAIQFLANQFINNGSIENKDTVSYTHLRAHETVLDLVCRLLLEKKKD